MDGVLFGTSADLDGHISSFDHIHVFVLFFLDYGIKHSSLYASIYVLAPWEICVAQLDDKGGKTRSNHGS